MYSNRRTKFEEKQIDEIISNLINWRYKDDSINEKKTNCFNVARILLE